MHIAHSCKKLCFPSSTHINFFVSSVIQVFKACVKAEAGQKVPYLRIVRSNWPGQLEYLENISTQTLNLFHRKNIFLYLIIIVQPWFYLLYFPASAQTQSKVEAWCIHLFPSPSHNYFFLHSSAFVVCF